MDWIYDLVYTNVPSEMYGTPVTNHSHKTSVYGQDGAPYDRAPRIFMLHSATRTRHLTYFLGRINTDIFMVD